MKIILPEESDKILTSQIDNIKNSDDAIYQFLKFYDEYKFKHKLEHPEQDMLLFQYGNYDLLDGNGKEFHFDITRQFEIPNEDEFLQLSLTLFYHSEQFGEIEAFNSWSIESQRLSEWEALIKRSEGYLKSKNLIPKRYNIELSET